MDSTEAGAQQLGTKTGKLFGDPAKTMIADDAFGLDDMTGALAELLTHRVIADGYTIGIEGVWGSGKSTLVNFILENLKKRELLTLKVIRFEPWLIGERRALLTVLFRDLRAKIEEFRSDARLKEKLKDAKDDPIEKLVASLAKYQTALEIVGAGTAAISPIDPSGHGAILTSIISFLSLCVRKIAECCKANNQTLDELRESVKEHLRTLDKFAPNTRFIVVIDDLDRLEPCESVEILRLIRAVADFPLVTYLLCYDRQHLAEQIKGIVGVGNGHDYLQKIFQNVISVPPQEPFALRRYTRQLLVERFPEEFDRDVASHKNRINRLEFFFDSWVGKFVTTPREAVRLADAVTLGWPNLRGTADFVDFAWLQLIKLECPALYDWVRDYVVNVGSYRDGGRPGDTEPQKFAQKLREILQRDGWEIAYDTAMMRFFLPGVEGYCADKNPAVFHITGRELGDFECEMRLGSPSHWRLYFAFDKPSYAIGDDVLAEFRLAAKANDLARGVELSRKLLERSHQQPGFFFGVALDRFFDMRDRLTSAERKGMANILGNVMDEVPTMITPQSGISDPWRRAEKLLFPEAADEFLEICRNGTAINWLTEVIRSQGFAHGRPHNAGPRDDPWLAPKQFQVCLDAILERIYAMGIADMIRAPDPLGLLYCWLQLGDPETLRREIDKYTSTDEGLLSFLESIRLWVSSSDRGKFQALKSRDVENFMELKKTGQRVFAIGQDGNSEAVRRRAATLLDVWDWDLKKLVSDVGG
jgi:Cdc6-like AAA superfamily ATPase